MDNKGVRIVKGGRVEADRWYSTAGVDATPGLCVLGVASYFFEAEDSGMAGATASEVEEETTAARPRAEDALRQSLAEWPPAPQ